MPPTGKSGLDALVLPTFELLAQPLSVAVGPAILLGDSRAPTPFQVFDHGAAQNGRPALLPNFLVCIQARQELFVEHDLYGLHVDSLSTWMLPGKVQGHPWPELERRFAAWVGEMG